MANKEHLSLLLNTVPHVGVKAWNEWRQQNPEINPDLSNEKIIGSISANLNGADFSGANLSGTVFDRANLSEADFRNAALGGATISQSILTAADLSNANLMLANLIAADLSEAVLIGTNLSCARLGNAKLQRSDLTDANVSGADLSDSDLANTKLIRVFAGGANFSRANLTNANLQGAILVGANLFGANLEGTDFSDAEIGTTLFVNNDLSFARGLETVHHFEPSSIGVDTIYRSGSRIHESFLRGAGIPDEFIAYARALLGKAIEFYSCFISYSSNNHSFAERLYADLQALGIRCWFAPEDLKIGDKMRVRIDESIKLYDKLLLILSKDSIKSEWVKYEIETALKQEDRQNRIVLYPIRLDDAVMESQSEWALSLKKTRNIGDFRHWKDHNSYNKSLSRLVRDLKVEETIA